MPKFRKDPLVKVVGLRATMDSYGVSGMNARELSKYLELEYTHTNKIVVGAVGVSSQVLHRLVMLFGSVFTEMDGVVVESRRPDNVAMQALRDSKGMAESAWIAKEEQDEAVSLVPRAVRALQRMKDASDAQDLDELSFLYEQLICDPTHALNLMDSAFRRETGELYETIRVRATDKHRRKIVAKVGGQVS